MLPILKRFFWLFGILVFLSIIFLPGYTKLQELKDKNRDLAVKIKELYIESALLKQELNQVQNDPFYQERIAREKMGIVRKGEIPIKIIPEKKR
ncbi:MAG: septum formation initiator family protein [Candidatus Omnitrophica bacterium]|nr:septum formation initiator family protein [Candidatus Omnitrophota bacterium]